MRQDLTLQSISVYCKLVHALLGLISYQKMSVAELSKNVEKLRFMAKARESEERKKIEGQNASKIDEARWVAFPEVLEGSVAAIPKCEPLKGKGITPRRSFGGFNTFLEQKQTKAK